MKIFRWKYALFSADHSLLEMVIDTLNTRTVWYYINEEI